MIKNKLIECFFSSRSIIRQKRINEEKCRWNGALYQHTPSGWQAHRIDLLFNSTNRTCIRLIIN